MAIVFYEDIQIWVLRTKRTDYVIGIDDKGNLKHLYWGGKQTNKNDYAIMPREISHPGAGQLGPYKDEIMPWSALRYSEPGIKVTFADDVRDLRLFYSGFEVKNENELTIIMKEENYQLTVKVHYKIIYDHDLIERSIQIQNNGTSDIVIEQLMGAIWHFPIKPEYRITYLAGLSRGETQIRQEFLQEGKKVLESRQGRTSHQLNPWFAIDFGETNEEYGELYFGAVAFSGNWKIVAERTSYQTLHVATGFNDFDFTWNLKPGETFTSPVCVGGYTNKGFGMASRNIHDYQRKYVLRNANLIRPVIYNTWYATEFDFNIEKLEVLADKAASLGAEVFVVDDGWFGDRDHDRAGLGDWYPNKNKFPNGLKPIIEKVKSLGMKFGIWVEPEMVNPDSNLYRKHPDWVYHFPTRKGTLFRNQLVLNLSREDVQRFVFETMDNLLSENDISYVKWDMNRSFTEPGWNDVPSTQKKEIWVRHTLALYNIWARLQGNHPHVMFESCSGGGARVDLGIMKYADQMWPSDNTDPYDRLFIQEGNSYAYVPKSMMAWVTDSPDENNLRETSLKYRFHSAMMYPLGFSLDLNNLTNEEIEEIKMYISKYKEIRHTVQDGDLYRLLSPRSPYGCAVQYVKKDRSQSALFVFRHKQQFREPFYPVILKGLDRDGIYYSKELDIKCSGASLMTRGVQLNLRGDYSSELVIFNRIEK